MTRPALVAGLFLLLVAGPPAPETSPAIGPEAAKADFEALWKIVSENYAYLDSRLTDWARVRELYQPDLEKVRTRSDLIGVLERVIDELYDAHAQLNQNTATSPRLVPSGADIWARWSRERAIVLEVREESDAEKSGLPDAELLTAITALAGSTLSFQPAIVPSSVAKISVAGAVPPPPVIWNPLVALVATPVGLDIPPAGAGIVTTASPRNSMSTNRVGGKEWSARGTLLPSIPGA